MEFNATFIVSAISFIVFVFIMNAIFYKPLQKVVFERQNFIDETTEEAKAHREKSEAILKDKAQKLDNTKHEAKKIIAETADAVKSQKATLAADAQQKAVQKIESAKNTLIRSSDEVQDSLAEKTQDLAQSIASKILRG